MKPGTKLIKLGLVGASTALLFSALSVNVGRAADSVTVNWLSWNPSAENGKLFVDAFNAAHPGITLVYKTEAYNDYLNDLKLQMASGTGPDVFGLQAGSLVNQYNQFTEDLAPVLTSAMGANWASNFYDLGLKQVKIGDKLPGIPWYLSAAGYLWYNKTLFDKYNLKPPTTLAEWEAVVKALNAQGVTGFIQGAKDSWIDFDMYIAIANQVSPGKIYDAEAGKVKWTDPDLVKAMDIWHTLFTDGIMQKGALGISQYPDGYDAWAQGKAGMVLMGTWNDDALTKTRLAANNKTYGTTDTPEFAYVPFPDVAGTGKTGRLFGGPDVVLAVNKDSKVKDAALEVIKWMVGEDAQKIQARLLNFPSIKSVQLDTSDVSTPFQLALLKTQGDDLANAIGKREFLYPEIQSALSDALQNVATDTATSADALAAVEKASAAIQR